MTRSRYKPKSLDQKYDDAKTKINNILSEYGHRDALKRDHHLYLNKKISNPHLRLRYNAYRRLIRFEGIEKRIGTILSLHSRPAQDPQQSTGQRSNIHNQEHQPHRQSQQVEQNQRNQSQEEGIESQQIEEESRIGDVLEEDLNHHNLICKNCKRHQYCGNNCHDIYRIVFIESNSSIIRQRKKFRHYSKNTRNVEHFVLCSECHEYLCTDNTASLKNSWPAFIWTVISDAKIRLHYGNKVWQFIPIEWRHWWINSIDSFDEYSNVSIINPPSLFIDRTPEMLDWINDLETQNLARLANACNKYMIPKILCPWGCSEFNFRCGHLHFDCIWQRFLPHCILTLIEDNKKLDLVKYTRDDYIRFDDKYDCWLFNSDWRIKPSIAFIKDVGPRVLCCRHHEGGNLKLMIHPPRQPKHILPCKFSDQLCHAVIKPRTIAPMKAQKYSNSFQLHEQRGSFNGIDTCSVTNYHNFALQSYLLGQYESRSIKNRPDINSMLTQLCKEKQIPPSFVEIMRSNASALDFGIDIDEYIRGATYVPVDTAMQLQRESKAKPIKVIWDVRQNENLPIMTKYCRRSFVITTFPLQKCNKYGIAFPNIPTFSSRNVNTSILWIMSVLLTRVEVLWQAVCDLKEFRQSCWHGWMLTYLTKKCFSHTKMRSEKNNPFQMTFMSSVAKLHNKFCSHTNPALTYPQVPLRDVFIDLTNVICMNTLEEIRESIDTNKHDIVIVENHIDIDQSNNPRCPNRSRLSNNEFINSVNYELCTVISIHFSDELSYKCEAYSRHGGQHSLWWFQNRSDSICTQSTCGLYPQYDNENLESSRTIAVYTKTKNDDNSAELYQEFLSYIGGQSHIVCTHHKLPLISTVDRKKKCRCGRNEHYSCPQLDCKVCICQKCSDQCDHLSINYISDNDNTNSLHATELNTNVQEEVESEDEFEFDIDDVGEDVLERDNFDDFMMNGGMPDLSDNEDGNEDTTEVEDDFFDNTASVLLPSSDAGSLPMEITDEVPKRGSSISGHVILNQCGAVLTRKKHQLKGSSLHKHFLQRICATSMGKSVSLMYPEGMLFPCIFYKMYNRSIIGAIPSALLSESIGTFGFASLPDHIRTRLTASGFQTSTNPRYISFLYDTMVNLSVNHSHTRIALNRGLTACDDESSGLGVRGKNDSAMLESIDSKQMVKNLTAAQKYFLMDMFLTFTCNQKKHFGTKPIKEWIDSGKWKHSYDEYFLLSQDEQNEITNAMNQSSAHLLLRAWNETCRYFLDYLRKSPSSPYRNVVCMFARHEYQKDVGNLPHIHAMIKIGFDKLNESEKQFVNELIRASILEIVRPEEVEKHIQEGIISHVNDIDEVIKNAQSMLPHHCSERCLKAVGMNKYACRKINYLKMNSAPNNTRNIMQDLPNDLSMECLLKLEKTGLIDPLVIHDNGYVEPFKSSYPFFHPKRHLPPVLWTHDMNISPVEGKTFIVCQSMQNIQKLTNTGGCNKYVVKYLGKIDEQNYVIIYADTHKNGALISKRVFLHNTKITGSKINEDKMLDKKREASHTRGRAVSLMEMIHSMLKYSEVFTDLAFVPIATTPLEIRPGIELKFKKRTEDGAIVGNIIDNVRKELGLPEWRQLTANELLIAKEVNNSNISIDKISHFSLRPSELRHLFDQVGIFYRWFKIDLNRQKESSISKLMSANLLESSWIDALGFLVKVRKKALPFLLEYIETIDSDIIDNAQPMISIFEMLGKIVDDTGNNTNAMINNEFIAHAEKNLIYNDDHEDHLPIPVFSYIRPTMGTQFILHLLLSLGSFSTELDLVHHSSIRESLRHAKLIGEHNDLDSLQSYSNDLLKMFITEQLIFFPNTRQVIDSWIITAGELLDDVIVHDQIPIASMPPVQQTAIFASIEEDKVQYINAIKLEVVTAALMELSSAVTRCSIPSKEELLNASKGNPLDWDALFSLTKSPNQPDESFTEQKSAIDVGIQAIDIYCNVLHRKFVKSITIRGYAGCGKSWTMQYIIAYAISKGLTCLTSSIMARRSVFLGGKHIHQLFCLPIEKNMSSHKRAETAICKMMRYPERLNLIRVLDVLFLDEIGQCSAELLSVLDIILRRLRDNNIFFGGLLVISTMDHTQLQPIEGRPFLLSSHVITCFQMVQLQTSVRAATDIQLQRIQQIASMHYSKYIDKPDLLDEFRNLLSETCVFVSNWNAPEITPSTYRLYGKRVPANDATKQFIDNVRLSISSNELLEKESIDVEKNRYSHCDWELASSSTKEALNKKVKEPSTILFFRGAVYEFTFNSDGVFSQSQMCILFDLPSQDDLNRNRKIKVLIAPPGIHDIEFDNTIPKEQFIAQGFVEAKVGLAPERIQFVGRNIQAQRKQYGLKHRVTSTIHAAMGDTLLRVATKISNDSSQYKLWDKAQVIVTLSRTKKGKDIIFVGDKEGTLDALVQLIQRRTQWTDYMENVLKLVTINNGNGNNNIPTDRHLNQTSFPFRICDVSLPQCNTGFVYFLISIRRQNFTYIGETKCIRTRLNQHNRGHGSSSTRAAGLLPFAVMAYICGFDGLRPLRLFIEKRWKEKRDDLIQSGIEDPKEWAKCGVDVINEVNQNDFPDVTKSALRLVLLFRDD